jgi:hypothetical protein
MWSTMKQPEGAEAVWKRVKQGPPVLANRLKTS